MNIDKKAYVGLEEPKLWLTGVGGVFIDVGVSWLMIGK